MAELNKYKVPFWIGLVFVIVSTYLSGKYGIFDLVPDLDKLFHVLGGFIAAWLAVLFFSREFQTFSSFKRALVIVSVTCLVGVVWEIAEYLSTVLAKDNYPLIYQYYRSGGFGDTMADLAANMLGAAILSYTKK